MYRLVKVIIVLISSSIILAGCGQQKFIRKESGDMSLILDGSDQEISDKTVEKIIKAINEKDADSVKSIFSKDATDKSGDMDENIQKLFSFIDEEIVSYEKSSSAGSFESFDSNYKIKLIDSYYYVSTANNKYFFLIDNYSINTKNPECQGVKLLLIVNAEDRLKVYDGEEKILIDGTEEIDRNGIFIPDMYRLNE